MVTFLIDSSDRFLPVPRSLFRTRGVTERTTAIYGAGENKEALA